jgi:uncharacterized delta-60 repeat protein
MQKLLLLRCWLLSWLLSAAVAAGAQSVDPSFAALSLYRPAIIDAAAEQPDGKLVVSGTFARINGTPTTSGIARLNPDGTLDQAFTSTVGATTGAAGLCVLPNGQILAFSAGSLVMNGLVHNGLVKLNADGTVASGFGVGSGPAGGTIRVILPQPDGKILVGGGFTGFNGTPAAGLVRLNADGTLDQAFGAALGTGFGGGEVFVLARQNDGRILAGGNFASFNGTSRRALVRLEAAGSLDTSYNPVIASASTAYHLALDPVTGQAVVVGISTGLGPTRLNLDGSQDPSFQVPSAGAACLTNARNNNGQLIVDGSRNVLLARSCTSGGSSYVTRYTASGALDHGFNAQAELNGGPNVAVRLASGQILLGGAFTRYGGTDNVNLVQVNSQGVLSSTFRPQLDANGTVSRLLRQPDGKLLLAGVFREINGQPAANLARLNADGTPDTGFGLPVFNGPIDAMALQPDGRILVGGSFYVAAGVASPMLARLLANGTFDASFQQPGTTSANYTVRSLAVLPDGKVLLGTGSSTVVGGRSASLHRYLPTGQLDVAYGQTVGAVTGNVADLVALPDGRHYVAGTFSTFGGSPAEGLVRLLPDGSPDPTFARPSTSPTPLLVNRVLLAPNGQIIVGGIFSAYRGHASTNVVRLNDNGLPDPTLRAAVAGNTLALYVQADGKIINGSSGSHLVGGVNQGGLSRLNADGTLDNSFVTGPAFISGNVLAALVQPDGKLVIGGSFGQVAGQPRMGVARLTAPGLLSTAGPVAEARTQVWPVPAATELHLRVSLADRPRQLVLLDALGRVVRRQQASATAEQTLSVRQLPAGVYLLRVDYADGPATRRVVVE